MPRKPRRLKTPVQLWVIDNRARLGLSSKDLADVTGVTEDTARGWESRGRPGEEALRKLEERFGQPAPSDPDVAVGDQSALVAAMDRQTEAITALVSRLDLIAEPLGQAVAAWLEEQLRAANRPAGSGAASAPARRQSARSPQGAG